MFFPKDLQGLAHLKELRIDVCGFTGLPSSITRLQGLRLLHLLYWPAMRELPHDLGNLSELRDLKLVSMEITSLPDSLGDLSNLQRLTLQYLGLEALPDSISRLQSLRELTVSSCSCLTGIPEGITALRDLKQLKVAGCSMIEALPAGLSEIAGLRAELQQNSWK